MKRFREKSYVEQAMDIANSSYEQGWADGVNHAIAYLSLYKTSLVSWKFRCFLEKKGALAPPPCPFTAPRPDKAKTNPELSAPTAQPPAQPE